MAIMAHGLQGARKSHSESCHLHHVTVLVYYVPMTRNEACLKRNQGRQVRTRTRCGFRVRAETASAEATPAGPPMAALGPSWLLVMDTQLLQRTEPAAWGLHPNVPVIPPSLGTWPSAAS